MLKKFYDWLRASKESAEHCTILHIKNWNQSEVTDERLFERASKIMGLLGVRISEDNYYRLNYHDIVETPVKEIARDTLQAYQYETDKHAIVVHSGDDGSLWNASKSLVQYLLKCYGYKTVTVIGYCTGHEGGSAHTYRYQGGKVEAIKRIDAKDFMSNREFLLTGK